MILTNFSPCLPYVILAVMFFAFGTVICLCKSSPICMLLLPGTTAIIIAIVFAARAALLTYLRNAPGSAYFTMNASALDMSASELLQAAALFEKVYYISMFRRDFDAFLQQAFSFQLALSLFEIPVYAIQLKKGRVSVSRFSGVALAFLAVLLTFCAADRALCLTPRIFSDKWDARYEQYVIDDFNKNYSAELSDDVLVYIPAQTVSIGYASELIGENIFFKAENPVHVYNAPNGDTIGSISNISFNELHGKILLTKIKGWRYIEAGENSGFVKTVDLLRAFARGQDHFGKGIYSRMILTESDRTVYNTTQWRIPTYDLLKFYYPFEYFLLIPSVLIFMPVYIHEKMRKTN